MQPLGPHEHWHVDISYLNLGGTFYYLCSMLDGYSRYIVHWEIRESMTEQDVETIVQRAVEKYPGVTPRIISDNGPQFIAKDFKSSSASAGMTHVRTSPYYPQSNGKLERWHGSLKRECIRPAATGVAGRGAAQGGLVRRALQPGALAQRDRLRHAGGQARGPGAVIFAERDRKLEAATRSRRKRSAKVA